jgi:adenylosuccinate lyase
MGAWEDGRGFRERLAADPDVMAQLDAGQLDELFDIDRALSHVPAILDRALS